MPTIKDLLTKSQRTYAKDNSKNCLVSYKTRARKNKDIRVYRVKCSGQDSKNTGHLCAIWIDPDSEEEKLEDREVRCKCSCPFWTFYGSKYHSKRRDYNIKGVFPPIGDDSAPRIRDPQNKNLICKHVYITLKKMVEKGDV